MAIPLTVWIALALMAIAAVAYLTGILMEDILAFFSAIAGPAPSTIRSRYPRARQAQRPKCEGPPH